jgi:signal transduction histidine kinase
LRRQKRAPLITQAAAKGLLAPSAGERPGTPVSTPRRVLPDEGQVEIAVADTGRGIPAADQKQIFEPFFSTKEPGRGTGLGLFITAEIVREHKGRIESDEGRGSTFRVVLPAAESAA